MDLASGSGARTQGPLRIGVGYGWDTGAHALADARWRVLREFAKGAAEDGWRRARAANRRAVELEDDGEENPTSTESVGRDADRVRGVCVARLRATAGDFTWPSIVQHIDDCDVLIFDMTPTKRVEGTDGLFTTPNVWLELGYALHTGKPVYVVHESADGHRSLPSDLRGLMVGRVASDGKQSDASLRMSLVNTVRKLLLASLDADARSPIAAAEVQS